VGDLDGSKGREEMERRRDEAIRQRDDSSAATGVPEDEVLDDEVANADLLEIDDDDDREFNIEELHNIKKLEATFRKSISPKDVEDDWEVTVKLGGNKESEYNWRFPPSFRDYKKLLVFWATTAIPDSALMNLYAADRFHRPVEQYEAEFLEWSRQTPNVRKLKKRDPEAAERISNEWREREAFVERVRSGGGLIPKNELRDAARIGGFWFQALHQLSEQDRHRAFRTWFELPSGEVVSVGDYLTKYRLEEILHAYFDRTKYTVPDWARNSF